MKKLHSLLALAAVLCLGAAALSGCQSPDTAQTGAKSTLYTCPMHPEVVSATAGKCPKCGMSLETKK